MIIDPTGLSSEEIRRIGGNAIVPRPIVLISTIGGDGVLNVAPFSLITQICIKPLVLGVSIIRRHSGARKDTFNNIEKNKEFTINLVTEEMAGAMNTASRNFTGDIDEFREAGFTPVSADLVTPPLVAESPVNMECRLMQIMEFGSERISNFVIGEVIRIHIRDEFFADGRILLRDLDTIANLGGDFYCRTSDIFEMRRLH
jgi:flavin reductase (DIM6/NTAB) family NADH-FMN oxidoreductase RutF